MSCKVQVANNGLQGCEGVSIAHAPHRSSLEHCTRAAQESRPAIPSPIAHPDGGAWVLAEAQARKLLRPLDAETESMIRAARHEP